MLDTFKLQGFLICPQAWTPTSWPGDVLYVSIFRICILSGAGVEEWGGIRFQRDLAVVAWEETAPKGNGTVRRCGLVGVKCVTVWVGFEASLAQASPQCDYQYTSCCQQAVAALSALGLRLPAMVTVNWTSETVSGPPQLTQAMRFIGLCLTFFRHIPNIPLRGKTRGCGAPVEAEHSGQLPCASVACCWTE